jgi:hypothetical protein
MSAPVAFVVTLLPERGRDGIRDLRFLLKIAKRHLHLRAIDVRETIRDRDARRRIVSSPSVEEGHHNMTSLRKFGPTNRYLKLEDLHGKPPLRERIGLVKPETGKFGERLVVTFEPSGMKLSLNRTSTRNLLRDLGEDDSDWIGKLVEIFVGEVTTNNGTMDAVLVRAAEVPVDAAGAVPTKKTAKPSDNMDDTIPF